MRQHKMRAKPGEKGDCLRASLASLFDVEFESVPHFLDIPDDQPWWPAFSAWLAERGLYALEQPADFCAPPGLYIAMGHVLGGTGHAVVARSGKVVWDPRPYGTLDGFEVESVIVFLITDAAAFGRWKAVA